MTPFDLFVWDNREESVVSELGRGEVIGLGLTVSDFDEPWGDGPPIYDSAHILPPGGGLTRLGDGMLLGPGGEIPPKISAVESITWARIKARFVK